MSMVPARRPWLRVQRPRRVLKRVVDEHPGTQWAITAQREIKEPFGFKWVETYVNPIVHATKANERSEKTSLWYLQKTQLNLAARLGKQGNLDKAREELGKVGDLKPESGDASAVIRQRGELFAILGLWDRAAADFSGNRSATTGRLFHPKSSKSCGFSQPESSRQRTRLASTYSTGSARLPSQPLRW